MIVGEACLRKVHRPEYINVNKTYLLANGRPSVFEPCPSIINVKESCQYTEQNSDNLFARTENDKHGLSVEDKTFLSNMKTCMHKNSCGNCIAPLPFRSPRMRMPNNRQQAVNMAQILDASLHRKPSKKKHFVSFMGDVLENGHAELAPPLRENEEAWYLPMFGVYHQEKPNQIRGVFYSSAKVNGVIEKSGQLVWS